MYRADHYEAADRLLGKANRAAAELRPSASLYQIDRIRIDLAAAQVHATLAAAPREVEAEVKRNEHAVSAAVVSAEETRVRLLGGSVDPVVEAPAFGIELDFEPTDAQRLRTNAEGIAAFGRAVAEAFTRSDDCEETDHDTRGDCDGTVKLFEQIGTSYGKERGSLVKLCRSHARSAVRFARVRVRPVGTVTGPKDQLQSVDRMCRCGNVAEALDGPAHLMGVPGCVHDELGRLR